MVLHQVKNWQNWKMQGCFMQFLHLIFVKKLQLQGASLQAPTFQLTFPFLIPMPAVAARWNSPGRCGGPSVLLLCSHLSAESMMPIRFRCACRLQCPVCSLNLVMCSCLARWLIGSVECLSKSILCQNGVLLTNGELCPD